MKGGQPPLGRKIFKVCLLPMDFPLKIKVGRYCVQWSDLMSDHNGQPKVLLLDLPLAFTTGLLELKL